jgi:hypothetical protein
VKVGEPVEFVARWSSFFGMRGRVVQVDPFPMITVGDDPRPIRVGAREVIPVDEPQHIGGAE